MYSELEKADTVFNIRFNNENNEDDMSYDPDTNEVFYDPHSALFVGSDESYQSPALGLAHEFGHAKQDLTGYTDKVEADYGKTKIKPNKKEYMIKMLEEPNTQYETKIANELGEPVRRYYGDFPKMATRRTKTPTEFKNNQKEAKK
jgi:hypothetical protein